MTSFLKKDGMRYKDSFYYWAAFIPHGFADVKLDEALLDRIHMYLKKKLRESKTLDQDIGTVEEMEATLASQLYHEIEELELTLSCQEYELLD